MTHKELFQSAAEFIAQRAQSSARAWPRIGEDIALVDENGLAGSLLFACQTGESMSNPLGIVHGGVTAALVDEDGPAGSLLFACHTGESMPNPLGIVHGGVTAAPVDENGPAGSLLFACHTDESMSNPLGIVHGGVTAALVDTCMGVTCTAQCGGVPTPTVTMTVNYARPVPLDADILVRVRTIRVGNTSGQLSAEVFPAGRPEEVLATATGVYAIRR